MKHVTLTVMGLVALPAMSPAVTVQGTAVRDRWSYFAAFSAETRQTAPIFATTEADSIAQHFNRRDGEFLVQWALDVPPEFTSQPFVVTSARVEVWNIPGATWTLTSTASTGLTNVVDIHATGFGPTYNEDTYDWANAAFVGSNNTIDAPRDPYPRDLVTNLNVCDNVTTATTWSAGVPVSYTPGSQSTPFKIGFDLDTTNPTIQQEFQDDFVRGASTWIVTSTHEVGGQTTGDYFPNIITEDGRSLYVGFDCVPTLTLELSSPASTSEGWQVYD